MFDFDSWAPTEPSADALRARYASLLNRLDDDSAAVLAEEDALVREVVSWTGNARIRYRQATDSEEWKAARKRADAMGVLLSELQLPLKQRLLAEPSLVSGVTAQEQARWANEVATFDPAITDDLVREKDLAAQYMVLLGGARVEFQGEELTLSALRKPEVSPDRAQREAATRARWSWFAEHRADLDQLFDKLVRLRASISQGLGHRDFVETGYRRRNRIDWGPAEADTFRDRILRHVVPLVEAIRAKQADRLGLEQLMIWDEPVHELDGTAVPTSDLEGAGLAVMRGLSEELGSFFELLRDGRLMDLRTRPGKGPGGFCSYLAGPRLPFIYANFAGTQAGVKTLVHELGHAFQDYSSRNHPRLADVSPTAEAAECHSMSLEFLAWPHMEAFFGDEADRYRAGHLRRALAFLPYGTAVDAFQHAMYGRPELSAAGRHHVWSELEASWMPWRDNGGVPHIRDGGFWQRQLHVYMYPFYYIDYVLAQVVALQVWRLSQTDHADALARWSAMCRSGGQRPFQEMVTSVGLRSPFEDGVVQDVVEGAATWLGL